jgi:heme exporter protein A
MNRPTVTPHHDAPAQRSAPEPMLAATGLACFRGDRQLFRDLDIRVDAGRALQIRGPNGCGKTTLLRILCGLTLPEAGTIRWRGRTLGAHDPEYLGALRYIGHNDGVKLALTPRENLRIAMALETTADEAALERALGDLGLAQFMDVACRTLSAGQRRRVALARLTLGRARLWLLDEPFTALDSTATATVRALIEAHLDGGGCAVLTSHQPIRIDAAVSASIELAP